MKPCRSPYCECTAHQCQHPGCYDARHEPYTPPFNPCTQCETQVHCERRGCVYSQPYNPDSDVRELAKWLNEEPNRELNRQALARVLAMAEQPASQPVPPKLTQPDPCPDCQPGTVCRTLACGRNKRLNHSGLREYALVNNLDYDELCQVVVKAIGPQLNLKHS